MMTQKSKELRLTFIQEKTSIDPSRCLDFGKTTVSVTGDLELDYGGTSISVKKVGSKRMKKKTQCSLVPSIFKWDNIDASCMVSSAIHADGRVQVYGR